MKVEERLLKYVGYHTTSDEASDKIPSSEREFALAKELESELKELGLSKVVLKFRVKENENKIKKRASSSVGRAPDS